MLDIQVINGPAAETVTLEPMRTGGRAHRLVVLAHSLPQKSDPKESF